MAGKRQIKKNLHAHLKFRVPNEIILYFMCIYTFEMFVVMIALLIEKCTVYIIIYVPRYCNILVM